jgi:hypothetical protein
MVLRREREKEGARGVRQGRESRRRQGRES